MRAPFAVGCSPAPSSMTPAFTSSSLNFAIAPSISSLGILPASLSRVALTITMKRIGLLPRSGLTGRCGARLSAHGIVGVHGADLGGRLRLAALYGRKARADARIGDAHRGTAFGCAAAVGRRVEHGQ